MPNRDHLLGFANFPSNGNNGMPSAYINHYKEASRPFPSEVKKNFDFAFNNLELLHNKDKRQLLFEVRDRALISLSGMEPRLPEKNSDYKKYKGGDALLFLKENWGGYLKYFTPELERDYLYQDWLREYDNHLMVTLDVQVRQRHHMKLADIVPTKKSRLEMIDKQIKSMKNIMPSMEPT